MKDNENTWDKLPQIKTTGRDDMNADQYRYPYEPTPYSVLERLANSGLISKSAQCATKKILLDCEEVWDEANPKLRKCSICKKSKAYNVRVGFVRRENGSVKWVYIGNRCTNCGTLGSYLDWKVNYEPTEEMEKNI